MPAMVFVYALLTHFANMLIGIAGVLKLQGKAGAFISGRRKHIPAKPLAKNGTRYWFHCASLGEFEQARPLMEALKSKANDCSIVITFFSPSGYTRCFDYELADAVLYLPVDTPGNARKLLNYLQADAAVFVKYELWYFHLKTLLDRRIPVYLLSAVFRKNHLIFRPWGNFICRLLPRFTGIFLQDKASFKLLEEQGLHNIQLSGDTRFDRVKQNALRVKENHKISAFKGTAPLLVLGSSWPEEEAVLLAFLNAGPFDFQVMIAPHDIGEKHIRDLMQQFAPWNPVHYTGSDSLMGSRILILDTIGHLASAYCYADLAYIGGGYGRGLHNILEPLSFGVPVLFGPEYQKHPEAGMALENGVAASVQTPDELSRLAKLWMFSANQTGIKAKCTDFINWHSGATEKVIKYMELHNIEAES